MGGGSQVKTVPSAILRIPVGNKFSSFYFDWKYYKISTWMVKDCQRSSYFLHFLTCVGFNHIHVKLQSTLPLLCCQGYETRIRGYHQMQFGTTAQGFILARSEYCNYGGRGHLNLFTDRIQSMGEGNVFTGVCNSVHRGSPSWGEKLLLELLTPSWGGWVSGQSGRQIPPPHHGMATAAVGTHPTGMHSFYFEIWIICGNCY